MHRSNPWASDWLKRYDNKDINGLKDGTKAGRPPALSEKTVYQIKKELKDGNNQGWATKQVEELIVKKSGIKYKISLHSHIPLYPSKMRILNRRCQVRYTLLQQPSRRERQFQKRPPRYLWISSNSNSNSGSKEQNLL